MANTQQPELKEPGPSDTQLPDFRKSNVGRLITLNFYIKKKSLLICAYYL